MHTDESTQVPATGVPLTMTAWRQTEYGGPDTVTPARIDVPVPGRGEVLLRVRATGLNSGDVRLMRGEPLIVRTAFGLRRPKRTIPGMDVAGTVVALGDGVDAWTVGDEVVGELPGGGLAEYAVAPVDRIVARPAELSPVAAAALPVAGGTAWQALERGRVRAGQRVLVIGASGGVGSFAVQLAADRGAEVWALCGARSRTIVEGLGATRTFDYREVQPGSPELGDGFDVVLDIAGTAPLGDLQRLVRDGGVVVMIAGGTKRVLDPIPRIIAGSLRSIGSKRPLLPLAAVAKSDVLRELVDLAATGRIRPLIEQTWPLGEARAALARMDAVRAVGKVVVTVA